MFMWDILVIGFVMFVIDDKLGEEQNGWVLKGLFIVFMLVLEVGEELQDNIDGGDVFGDICCLRGDFFGKFDGGDLIEFEELEFFVGEIVVFGGEVLLLSWLCE